MEVIYNNKPIKNNVFLKINETQIEPQININNDKSNTYTLIMYDPDAINGTYIHWIVTDIIKNDMKNGKILIPYKGPSPPPKTGKHRYIFELYLKGNNEYVNKRSISIINLRNKLALNEPIFRIQFISQNENGGKKTIKRKTTKRKTIKRKII